MVIRVTEIVLISKFGKKVCQPFTVNKAEAIAEEENIINSSSEEATNQDSEVAEDINADD